MALQPSGQPISFSQIANEFGLPSGRNLGAYRISTPQIGSLSGLPLDEGIPQSGAISFSNFYSKKLNVVVDSHSIPNFSTRQTARVRYNNQNVTVIGGFKTRPPSSANTRIIINVNRIIGSDLGSINNVALATGGWEGDTQLELEIGPSGQLYGSGGNGGRGADSQNSNSTAGGNGSSSLGIQYPTAITNRGYIQSGGGGGGGGNWTNDSRRRRSGRLTRNRTEVRTSGAGAGGGSGYPVGSGGAGGIGGATSGGSGGSGELTTGGSGGSPGNAAGGGGSNGGNGGNGTGKVGGFQGRAIIVYNDGSGTTVNGVPITSVSPGGFIQGPIIYNTNPT